MPADNGPLILVTLSPQEDPVPRAVRLRRALKYFLRACNCRCLAVEEMPFPPPRTAQDRSDGPGAGREPLTFPEG
jgi:hypothetical protein